MGDHLIVMHSAVRALPGYNRHDAPAIYMDGAVDRRADRARPRRDRAARRARRRRSATRCAPDDRPRAAGITWRRHPPPGARSRRGLLLQPARPRARSTPLNLHAPLPPTLEPMPDGMYRALEDVVELVVDGEYEELTTSPASRCEVEDLRRRVEDDCPEALVLPPREHYGIEAIRVRRARATRAGRTSWTCGPRRRRRGCTSRASWRPPTSASSSRSTTSCRSLR